MYLPPLSYNVRRARSLSHKNNTQTHTRSVMHFNLNIDMEKLQQTIIYLLSIYTMLKIKNINIHDDSSKSS